jgi:hypothetical protein
MKAILFLLFLKDFSCSIKIKFKKKRGGGKEGKWWRGEFKYHIFDIM